MVLCKVTEVLYISITICVDDKRATMYSDVIWRVCVGGQVRVCQYPDSPTYTRAKGGHRGVRYRGADGAWEAKTGYQGVRCYRLLKIVSNLYHAGF